MSPSAPPDVSIIVVSFNTREMTLACLRSVIEQTTTVSYELLVVDNDSHDGSAEAIQREFPSVTLIEPERNLGFARANNLAAHQATGEHLLLLNPDTVVLHHAIDTLVTFAQNHPDHRIYGGRTVFADGSQNINSCWRAPSPWRLFCHALALPRLAGGWPPLAGESYGHWGTSFPGNVDCVSGCFFLIERTLWNDLKGFDESYFMYGEDTDLCLRAAAKGATPHVCPHAEILHYQGQSDTVVADKMIKLLKARNQLIERHWPSWQHPLGNVLHGISVLRRWLTGIVLSLFGHPRGKQQAESFREIWKHRREWSILKE